MQKLKVGVLMGGKSLEKEVSFNSGRTVCDHLDAELYEIIPLFQTEDNKLYILPWKFLHRGKISDFLHKLSDQAVSIEWSDLKKIVDFIYIAVHGRYAEDGTLQGFLEVLGIPYLGAKVLASALGMDKILQKKWLSAAGISVPKDLSICPSEMVLYKEQPQKLFDFIKERDLNFPLVVKPISEGSSVGISVVFNKDELIPALEKAVYVFKEKPQKALIEEKIEGMEFTHITAFDAYGQVLLLPPTEVVHEKGTHFHDYEQKYMPGRSLKFTPARCPVELQHKIHDVCVAVSRILEFKTIARTDGFLTADGRVVVVDPNSLSGMAPSGFVFNQAAHLNMSHSEFINHLIETELHDYFIATRNPKFDMTTRKKSTQKKENKMRVAVLFGGDTHEREVSLDSGRNVCYKLSSRHYEVIPLFVDSNLELYPLSKKLLVHNATAEIEHEVDRTTKIEWHQLPEITDFVFIALHGGRGENGSVQGTLEMLGVPYNGSGIAASALCMDKYKTNTFLASQGFAVAKNILISQEEWVNNKKETLALIFKKVSLPVIVKPHNDGCSTGVSKFLTEEELSCGIDELLKKFSYAFIEEYIVGMELTVGVIGNDTPQALPPSQSLSAGAVLSVQEKFLPGAGENQTPAPLSHDALLLVQQTVEQVYKAVGCSGYSRIDCFYQTALQSPTGKERVVILEINSLPALTPATCLFHQASEIGIKPTDFLELIIQLGLEKHASCTLYSNVTHNQHFNNQILEKEIQKDDALHQDVECHSYVEQSSGDKQTTLADIL